MRGFRLAGIAGEAVTSAQQASQALDQAGADCLIVILTEKVAEEIRQQIDSFRLERSLPLIVEIPGPEGRRAGKRSLRQIVQEAVGINLGWEEGH